MIRFESIHYLGGKARVLPHINEILTESLFEHSTDFQTVLDGFSGSTQVSQFFKSCGKVVTANDLAPHSRVLGECFLLAQRPHNEYKTVIDYLNNLTPTDGWFTATYGGNDNQGSSVQHDGLKRPFQVHVTRKLDAIRDEIEHLYPQDCIDKSVLLTALLLALDPLVNGLGHQVSYLRTWSKASYRPLVLSVPRYTPDALQHRVFSQDAFSLSRKPYDLCYFDPPYGTGNLVTLGTRVRYFSYYHLWTTVVKHDKPAVVGAARRREDVSRDSNPGAISVFEHLRMDVVEQAFVDLLTKFDTRFTLLSYSNRGKVTIARLLEIAASYQRICKTLSFVYKENGQAGAITHGKLKAAYDAPNTEYLILLERQ